MTLLRVLQEVLYWLASAVLAAGAVAYQVESLAPRARALLSAGLGVLSTCIVVRWVASGHLPLVGGFENSIAAVWSVGLVLVFGRRWRLVRALPADFERWLSLALVAFLLLGMFFPRAMGPMTVLQRSPLALVHVPFAWAAHTVLVAVSVVALLVLFGSDSWAGEVTDRLMTRGLAAGFAFFTAMIAAGSLWSFLLYADWFRWQVVEALAAAAWLAYAVILHVVMLFEWRGRKLAWALLAALPLLLGTFWIWSVYSGTYHHFVIPTIRAR